MFQRLLMLFDDDWKIDVFVLFIKDGYVVF